MIARSGPRVLVTVLLASVAGSVVAVLIAFTGGSRKMPFPSACSARPGRWPRSSGDALTRATADVAVKTPSRAHSGGIAPVLAVALLLIMFVNFVTLLFSPRLEWGSRQTERRAARSSAVLGPGAPREDSIERRPSSPMCSRGVYDAAGRRVAGEGRGLEPPPSLPPNGGGRRRGIRWKIDPPLLVAVAREADGSPPSASIPAG